MPPTLYFDARSRLIVANYPHPSVRPAQTGLPTGWACGLWEIAQGRGRKPTYGPDRIKAVIDTTLQSKPKGSTHWSCRTLAADQGVSKSTVNNILRSHNLKPHRARTFKLSRAPRFLEKLTDVVELYLNPPDRAIVLCVDEKSQTGVEIRALNRTQPGLPLKKGRCGAMTHDYKRNGTTTLFAALDLLERKVIGDFHKRHRHREFPKFPALDQPKASRKDSSALSHG